ncbi:MAG: Cytochrome c oxidase subunit 5A [Icmadophila ericetorum]|nr:Cytochrome c oxidase subunit 5A [Icmadophila ericetorum]
MLRILPRASQSSSLILHRGLSTTSHITRPISAYSDKPQVEQTRSASAHAISNPTLAGIEKRWEQMAPQEQAELWMALRDRMRVDWHELTLQEKKAVLGVDWGILAYWIAFGPHGPRSLPPPGEGRRVFGYTMGFVGISFVLFWIVHAQARPPPGTMNKEYQEATNEYLRSQNVEPISGLSSEGYVGKGQVQSGPKREGH